jgi:hypothetical protein
LQHWRGKLAIVIAATLLGFGGGFYVWYCYPEDDFRVDWGSDRPEFSLRQDRPPRDWKLSQINDGLPLRWEKGIVHVLAWEVIEDDRPWKYTQALVLKKFDHPTEKGGHTWVLAQLYHHPEDADRPWDGPMRIPPPYGRDEQVPKLTDAQVFGHEFYYDVPTGEQIETFLKQTDWTPRLGPGEAISQSGLRNFTRQLTAGGINPVLWERLFKREVPTILFPELKKAPDGEGRAR